MNNNDVIRGDDECVSMAGVKFPSDGRLVKYVYEIRFFRREDAEDASGIPIVGLRRDDLPSTLIVRGADDTAIVMIRRWEDVDESDEDETTDAPAGVDNKREEVTC